MDDDPIDPIIEEIHEIRRRIAEKFNYDVYAIAEDARKRQEASDWPIWHGRSSQRDEGNASSDANEADGK